MIKVYISTVTPLEEHELELIDTYHVLPAVSFTTFSPRKHTQSTSPKAARANKTKPDPSREQSSTKRKKKPFNRRRFSLLEELLQEEINLNFTKR